jgi:hypothetical protein
MSALPPKADIAEFEEHVRSVPKADIMWCSKIPAIRSAVTSKVRKPLGMIRERANCLEHGRPAPPAGPAVQFGPRRGCLNHRNRPAPAASTRCCTASSCGYENPRDWSAQLAAPSEMQRAYEGPRGHPRIAQFFPSCGFNCGAVQDSANLQR